MYGQMRSQHYLVHIIDIVYVCACEELEPDLNLLKVKSTDNEPEAARCMRVKRMWHFKPAIKCVCPFNGGEMREPRKSWEVRGAWRGGKPCR